MKRSIICLLLLITAASALPAQSENFKIETDINWERDLIRIRVENDLNPEIFVIQEEVNMFQHANKALIAAAFLFWQLSSFLLCWCRKPW